MHATLEFADDGAEEKARVSRSFEEVMIRHQRLVLMVAYRLLGSKEDAKDVAQEVFLRLHRCLGQLDAEREAAPWLYRVTANVCRDWQRRARRGVLVSLDGVERVAGAGDPERALAESERRRALAEALARLPEKERAAIVLREIDGLSTAEVAAILESSETTVRSQISMGRGRLRKLMGRVLGRKS